MRFTLTRRIILSISAIATSVSIIIGLSLVDVNGQKQLTTLNQFPNYLENMIEQSLELNPQNTNGKHKSDGLKGKDSYFYKIFLMSLDSDYLTTADKEGKWNLNDYGTIFLFTKVLPYIEDYSKAITFSTNDIQAQKIGSLIWNQTKTHLQENHLTFNATNGFGYVLSSMTHGQSITSLLATPSKQIKNVDNVLQNLLTEIGYSASYNASHFINTLGIQSDLPHSPDNITLNTPNINGIKVGIIFTIIISPILIILYILLLIGFFINKNYRFVIKNKITWLRQQLKTSFSIKPRI